jgi:thioredoxin reductase (NADPH)
MNARAVSEIRVLRVKRHRFQQLVSVEPDIGEIILRSAILRRASIVRHAFGGLVVVGPGHGSDTIRIQRFLTRNNYPYRLLDTDIDADAGRFLEQFEINIDHLPVVVAAGRRVIRNPSDASLAADIGLIEIFDPSHVFDVAIVGAGPSGLAAAVVAASEGLDTIVIEALTPGGQAAASSKIENYLGFPTGISGAALAERAQVQAQKFGVTLAVSSAVTAMECDVQPFVLRLEDGVEARARAIVIATGARYRKLDLPNYTRFEGQGIHYATSALEAGLCQGVEVIVVGGGNSAGCGASIWMRDSHPDCRAAAGQAAVFLGRSACHVHLLIRGDSLSSTMSEYLIQRIRSSPAITLHRRTEITKLDGDDSLREVTWVDHRTGATETHAIGNVFVMIGAAPNTEWLAGCVGLDRRGFVKAGFDGNGRPLDSPFATTILGVYAVGDVPSGSTKRVAAAVGEGSVVVQAIRHYLDPMPP